jgi:hypothetical protein
VPDSHKSDFHWGYLHSALLERVIIRPIAAGLDVALDGPVNQQPKRRDQAWRRQPGPGPGEAGGVRPARGVAVQMRRPRGCLAARDRNCIG